jgi:hypothetical protein
MPKPAIFVTCEYCGTENARVIDYEGGVEKMLMFPRRIPYHPKNPFLAIILKSRQVWVCGHCVNALK